MTTQDERPIAVKWYAAAAAVVAIAALATLPGLLGGSSTPTTVVSQPLALSLGESNSMASCIAFDTDFLAQMPVAFEGTVTEVGDDRVTLSVDHWFAGAGAAVVELAAPAGLLALIDGIEFVQGSQYLITATDGTVNYCGFSGLSTPELRVAFEEAFGA
ncbi:MAG: hypothetical protein OEX04_09475 [Acidimicrobiia bacterium]|nr:hypothetical protein [Acidimicrobiia bacterium]MDH4307696.1 hypothetical protein [Acidimicrobiia bacterium]MDH5294345.1 hypothetical protein [Acidimicrobiia bacterium]